MRRWVTLRFPRIMMNLASSVPHCSSPAAYRSCEEDLFFFLPECILRYFVKKKAFEKTVNYFIFLISIYSAYVQYIYK